MPRIICKLTHNNKDYYLEWSTIVDAPRTYGMSLEEFKAYYRDEYGRSAMMIDFPEQMKQVEKTGISARGYANVDELISCNRAGDRETELTKEEIIQKYCVNRSSSENL